VPCKEHRNLTPLGIFVSYSMTVVLLSDVLHGFTFHRGISIQNKFLKYKLSMLQPAYQHTFVTAKLNATSPKTTK
jgi:hypothetical protein